jgi:uncharacterized membrane protein (GlpM family)
VLILKLLLIPGFLLLISLAGKRWGPSVAGWLSGLPVVVGPILFFLAIEQGPAFAAHSAVAALSAMFAMIAFCITYAQVAQRANWPLALTASLSVWAVIAVGIVADPGVAAVFRGSGGGCVVGIAISVSYGATGAQRPGAEIGQTDLADDRRRRVDPGGDDAGQHRRRALERFACSVPGTR